MSWSITLTNVTKKYGERTILDDISLTIPAGETVAILGPSGGGKSTLIRCVNGLNTFDAGEIEVGPHRVGPTGPKGVITRIRQSFGMIFQDFQLFPHFSVLENITEAPIRVLGERPALVRERAMLLLKRVGLADRATAYPRELSGGQKQRIAIARALAMNPRGLLCDEITSSLDPEIKTEVLNVLEDLKRDGMTLVLVTHEIGFARRVADRVVVLCDGRIIENGPPASVLDNPQSERMAAFLKCVMG
ncbi:MAG: amino acid ABC transporter ATP-binding protein [Gemmataceae bacterium]|nr:amino acid ABC transporter ATP-binding protein [Gemmataceae bacterium]